MAALSALRTRLGVKLTDQNLRILTAAQMNALLNEALEAWVDETGELVQETAFAVTAKEFDIDAPSDILEVKAAWWAPTSYSPVTPVGYTEFDEPGGFQLNRSGGTPELIMLEGTQSSNAPTDLRLRLFPAPTATSATSTINDAGGISASDATIGVTAASTFRSPSGWIQIDNEKILYQNLDTSTNQFKLCRRGMGNTTAATHSDGATITQLDLMVRYTRAPAALSSDADVPEINNRFHKYLLHYVLKEALALDGREKEALREERKWMQAIRLGKRAVRNIKAGQPFSQLHSDY